MSIANLRQISNGNNKVPTYEEYTQDIKFQRSQGVGTDLNATVTIVRFGNMCILSLPQIQLSGNTSNAYIVSEDPIPPRFIPAPSRQLLPDFIAEVPGLANGADVPGASVHVLNDATDPGNYGKIRICGAFTRNSVFNSTGGGPYGLFNDTAVCYMVNN